MDKTSLGDRMKGYEVTAKTLLLRRTPIVIRVDGKAFHTWTKRLRAVDPSLERGPFSQVMYTCMTETARAMVHNTQNAVFGYTQSDEISIVLNDWKTLNTDQWFGGNVQKIASVSASMAATYFNYFYQNSNCGSLPLDIQDLAQFDARVFNIPVEEVTNYFLWRQQDATRNSINMLGQHYFSHRSLHGKNVSQVQDMLMLEKGINWNNLAVWKKRGSGILRDDSLEHFNLVDVDNETPIFTQDRDYIGRHLLADVPKVVLATNKDKVAK